MPSNVARGLEEESPGGVTPFDPGVTVPATVLANSPSYDISVDATSEEDGYHEDREVVAVATPQSQRRGRS